MVNLCVIAVWLDLRLLLNLWLRLLHAHHKSTDWFPMILRHHRRMHRRVCRMWDLSDFAHAHETAYRLALARSGYACAWSIFRMDSVDYRLDWRVLHLSQATTSTEGLLWLVTCNQSSDWLRLSIANCWGLGRLLTGMRTDYVYRVMILVIRCILSGIKRAWKVGLILALRFSFCLCLKLLPILHQLLADTMF